MSEITQILQSVRDGVPGADEQLFRLVYDELRRVAAQRMDRERVDHTLQATALVHEVWLRLEGDGNSQWQNRAHFFSAAAEAMRRILIDRARSRSALRHGGDHKRIAIDALALASPQERDDEALAVHEALDNLAAVHPQKAELVKLRYFAGMTNQEAAALLNISEPTAKRWWSFARAWLFHSIAADDIDVTRRDRHGRE